MNQFVESLFRLYDADKIDVSKIDKLLSDGKISKQEYDYVLSAKQIN